MNNFLSTIMIVLLMSSTSFQDFSVTGKVTGEDGNGLPGVSIIIKGTSLGTTTDADGLYSIKVSSEKSVLVFSFIGYTTQELSVKSKRVIDVQLKPDIKSMEEVVVIGYGTEKKRDIMGAVATVPANQDVSQQINGRVSGVNTHSGKPGSTSNVKIRGFASYNNNSPEPTYHNTEEYDFIQDNIYHDAKKVPLSTFSIDVDKASYSNIRRYIDYGQMPPKDAVRTEELINYFTYDYPHPKGEDPFSVNTEIGECPWNNKHKLVQIGLQGKTIPTENLPPSNLVFLIDVSGSMDTPERLPLVIAGFKLLVEQLRPQDYVSIVVYAGAAGLVLEPTSGENKSQIINALNRLRAGGSTAGGEGIKLAYETAKKNFKENGNNRVILATDGDFNIGVSSNAEMERLITEKRETGVFLSVLGFGMGNYKDSKMEILADKGNGNYSYIDNIQEAKKVFVTEFGGTLFTIAKDVKLQIEFNPTKVKAYRLIGYENRKLADEDFNNDKKDAGDLGAGHTVTALYEIIPANSKETSYTGSIDVLKYQTSTDNKAANTSEELMNIKLRYKEPLGIKSRLIEKGVKDNFAKFHNSSENFRFAASVASFAMLLRDSDFKGHSSFPEVERWVKSSMGEDKEGYRRDFLKLVQSVQLLVVK